MKSRLTPERLTGLYALFLLTAFVLWTPATGYSPIVAPKHRLFLISAGVYFLGLGAVCLYRRQWPQVPKTVLWLTGGLALWFLLSSLLSEYPELVWLGDRRREGALTLFLYLAIFLAMAAFGKLGRLHAYGAAVTGVLLFILILPQFLGYNPLNLYPEGLCFHDRGARYSGEYLGTIGNSDLLSALLTMLCLYLAGAYAMGKGGLFLLGAGCAWGSLLLSEVTAGPVAVLGCLALALPLWVKKGLGIRRMGDVGLMLSLAALGKSMLGYRYEGGCLTLFPQFTRLSAVFLGLTLCSVAAMVVLRRLPTGKGYPKAARAIWILYALVILAVCLFLFFYGGSNETLLGLRGLLHGNPPDTLGSSRVAIWKEAVELGVERPLLRAGHLQPPLPTDFHPAAGKRHPPPQRRGRRPQRVPEPVGQYGPSRYAAVSGSGAAVPPLRLEAGRSPAAALPGLCHPRIVRHQPELGQSPVLSVPGRSFVPGNP